MGCNTSSAIESATKYEYYSRDALTADLKKILATANLPLSTINVRS